MNRRIVISLGLLSALLLAPSASDQYGSAAYRQLKFLLTDLSCSAPGACDLAAGTTIGGVAIGGGGVSDGDKGDVTVSGSGAAWAVDSGAVGVSELSGLPTCSGTDKLTSNGSTVSCAADSSGNSVEVSLAITANGSFFSTTVTGQTWVAAGSEIVCTPFGTTADGLTPEAITIGALDFSVSDKVVGTGFNLNVYSPNGLEGTVRAHCVGV